MQMNSYQITNTDELVHPRRRLLIVINMRLNNVNYRLILNFELLYVAIVIPKLYE